MLSFAWLDWTALHHTTQNWTNIYLLVGKEDNKGTQW